MAYKSTHFRATMRHNSSKDTNKIMSSLPQIPNENKKGLLEYGGLGKFKRNMEYGGSRVSLMAKPITNFKIQRLSKVSALENLKPRSNSAIGVSPYDEPAIKNSYTKEKHRNLKILVEKMRAESKRIKKKLKALTNKHHDARENIQHFKSIVESYEHKLEKQKEIAKKYKSSDKDKAERISLLEREIEEMSAELKLHKAKDAENNPSDNNNPVQLRNELKKLKHVNADLVLELDDIKNTQQSKDDRMLARIEEVMDQKNEIQAKYDKFEEAKEKLSKKISVLESSTVQQLKIKSQDDKFIAKLQKSNEEYQTMADKIKMGLKGVAKKLAVSKKKQKQLEKRLFVQIAENSKLESKLKKLSQDNHKKQPTKRDRITPKLPNVTLPASPTSTTIPVVQEEPEIPDFHEVAELPDSARSNNYTDDIPMEEIVDEFDDFEDIEEIT